MTRRTERIASELLAEISRLLREEVSDPRVGLVTLTRVDVAPDLSHALVYWSAFVSGPRIRSCSQDWCRRVGTRVSSVPPLLRTTTRAVSIRRSGPPSPTPTS